jgi:Domain of unknown function (DUF3127)
MKIEGRLHSISNIEEVSATFKKRNFVLEHIENPLYPQYLLFEVVQDRCLSLDRFKEGDYVSVKFNLKGRGWTNQEGNKENTKYINTLQVWAIELIPTPKKCLQE